MTPEARSTNSDFINVDFAINAFKAVVTLTLETADQINTFATIAVNIDTFVDFILAQTAFIAKIAVAF